MGKTGATTAGSDNDIIKTLLDRLASCRTSGEIAEAEANTRKAQLTATTRQIRKLWIALMVTTGLLILSTLIHFWR